jgi:hypothetical protein
LTVREPPSFTSDPETTFTVGEAGLYVIEADGHLPLTISQTGGTLPAGITFDAVSGVLSGTPVDGTGGVYELEFTAANEIRPDAVQPFTLTVNETPEFTSDAATTFILDEPGSFAVTVSGYPAPTFSTSDALPAGVTLAAGGLLSGTPTDGGTFPLTIRASNGVGTDATQAFTLTVGEPPSFTSAAEVAFTVGEEGSFTLAANGTEPIGFSQTDGTLPAGITFDTVLGVLSGMPADGTGGVYELEFTAANEIRPDAVQPFRLTVNEAPEFTSDDATTFTAGTANSFTFTASGYPAPAISTTDTLPQGLSLADGVLSGSPTAGGDVELTVIASNGVGTNATQTFALTIEKAIQATLVLTVTPAEGVTGDRLALDVTGGSGTGEVSYDVGESTACEIGTGTDAGMLVVIHGVGTCAVTATKASDTAYLAVTSSSVTVMVSRATTVLIVDDATGTFDDHATFTATLTTGGNPLAGRDVSFTGPGGVDLGSASTDERGVATLANVSLGGIAAGTYDLAASVARDDDYLETADDATLTIDKAAGAVRISNLPASAGVGNNVVLALAPLGDGTPSATSLTSDACTVDVNGIVTFLLEGECQLQASVTAGTNHEAATGVVQVVTVTAPARKATTTTLTSSANPATVGQVVTLTARVAPDVRNGTVTFLVDGRSIGTVAIGRRGTATIVMPTASAGTFNVRAVYDGTTTHAGSQSAPVVQNVQASTVTQTTTSLSSSANPVLAAQHVTFTAAVNPPTATGTVTFTAGRRVLGTAPVTGGQATLTTTLTKGTYSVVATYSGDATHAASTSQTLTQVVDRVQ